MGWGDRCITSSSCFLAAPAPSDREGSPQPPPSPPPPGGGCPTCPGPCRCPGTQLTRMLAGQTHKLQAQASSREGAAVGMGGCSGNGGLQRGAAAGLGSALSLPARWNPSKAGSGLGAPRPRSSSRCVGPILAPHPGGARRGRGGGGDQGPSRQTRTSPPLCRRGLGS